MRSANERARRESLVAAEQHAEALLAAIEGAGLIGPGRSEKDVEDEIGTLALENFGIERNWHRRIVRAGPNTLTVANDYPPVRIIAPDDTVYVDLGPVFAEWEADIGRTYALGSDPLKHKLVSDLPRVFDRVQRRYDEAPDVTGAGLYAFAQQAAEEAGWKFGGVIAGHVIGEFAHATWPGDKDLNRISPNNPTPLRSPDPFGRTRHWILEIHLVDRARTFGGFYERLL